MATQNLNLIDDLKCKAANLTYPAKPDGKGSARVNWLRHPYYFGKHNTLESFMLFGEWRRHLIETGEALEVKVIRRELAYQREEINHGDWGEKELPETSFQRRETDPPSQSGVQLALIAGGVVALFALAFAIGKFYSTPSVPMVDGVALTQDETDFIRGFRSHAKHFQEIRQDQKLVDGENSSRAETIHRLKEEGPINGKLHKTRTGT